SDTERRELYSKHACHELHLFLYFKDRAYFDAVVKPYLAHKRTKTFLDAWLLDQSLAPYLEPWQLARLNAVELALLAQRLRTDPALVRILGDAVEIQPPDPGRDTHLIDALLGASALDADSTIAEAKKEAYDDAFEAEESTMNSLMGMPGMAMGAAQAAAPMMRASEVATRAPAARPAPKKAKARRDDSDDLRAELDEAPYEADRESMKFDLERRRQEAPMFRAA